MFMAAEPLLRAPAPRGNTRAADASARACGCKRQCHVLVLRTPPIFARVDRYPKSQITQVPQFWFYYGSPGWGKKRVVVESNCFPPARRDCFPTAVELGSFCQRHGLHPWHARQRAGHPHNSCGCALLEPDSNAVRAVPRTTLSWRRHC